MLIELIRHSLTRSAQQRRYPGQDDEPLSIAGREALREADRSRGLVYVTTKRRTGETAGILFPGAKQVSVAGLEEMDFGLFGGKTADELWEDERYRAWVEGGCLGRCPAGEDREGFCRRVSDAFTGLVNRGLREGEDYLTLVCHGGTIMAVMERFAWPAKDYFAWNRPCGCGYLLEAEMRDVKLRLHLREETDYRIE